MRALVQRVMRARVEVVEASEVAGEIGAGLCVFVGVTHDDTPHDAERMADKIWFLRVLDDADGVMNRSLADLARDGDRAEALIVSQFTLYGDTDKGRRPSWIDQVHLRCNPGRIEAVAQQIHADGCDDDPQ